MLFLQLRVNILMFFALFFSVVDAMDMPFLNAYLDSLGAPNFRKGCNYAAAGSTVLPATATSVSPFSFGVQVNQFLHFKARVLELREGKGILVIFLNMKLEISERTIFLMIFSVAFFRR